MEEARNDGDTLLIKELEEHRQSFFARVEKEKHGRRDKNLDRSAKRRLPRPQEHGASPEKLILSKMSGLAQYLMAGVTYREGWWTYRPQRTSRLWQT